TVLKTFNVHYNEIINYFINRSTNASAKSFNAKIKYFRMMYRGVRDKKFFRINVKSWGGKCKIISLCYDG
ncbi:transposase, partial [Myroides odoratimimus]|uniref:transposase n=1 Tax=Myroides odoratimimus TaxID=76832 RepID=UPI002096CC4B